MKSKLFLSAIIKFFSGVLIVFLLLFIPAGSFEYTNGWLLMELLFLPMFIVGMILLAKNPKLLENRLDAKEKEMEQKKVVITSGLMFIIGFVLAGLNYRFSWILLPDIVVYIASGIFIISYILYAEVLRENPYLFRTIEVKENQELVDTGLYGIVRHPMYMTTVFLFLSMPLILNSIISFVIFLIYPYIISRRIKNEEEVLEKELEGYIEYKKKVRYKLIPFIW